VQQVVKSMLDRVERKEELEIRRRRREEQLEQQKKKKESLDEVRVVRSYFLICMTVFVGSAILVFLNHALPRFHQITGLQVSSLPNFKQILKANVLIGKFIDQTFHVVVERVRAPAPQESH